MTAPRKPVAWQWLDTANFRKKVPVGCDSREWSPLYTATDLQPLWALVERWEKEAQTFADAGGDIAMAEAAVFSNLSRELRAALEAMQ